MKSSGASSSSSVEWPNVKAYKVIDVPTGLGICMHTFFVKEHIEKGISADSESKGRTLFVGNIDYGKLRSLEEIQEIMTDLFGSFGNVESVSVSEFKNENAFRHQNGSRTTRFAHVTFSKRSELKAALNTTYEAYAEGPGVFIMEKWGAAVASLLGKRGHSDIFDAAVEKFGFGYSNTTDVKQSALAYLKEFEENEQIAKAERERRAQEADEDGFVTVKTRNKKRSVAMDGSSKRGGKPRSRGAKKQVELKNFYRFQQREEKKNKLFELKEKFEQDRKKIAELKSNRKFKPF